MAFLADFPYRRSLSRLATKIIVECFRLPLVLDRNKDGIIVNKKIFISIVVILLFFPFPTVSIPEWRIQVVDEIGIGIPNERLRQEWSHNGISAPNSEVATSDEKGFVTFPEHTLVAPLILRIGIKFLEWANYLVMPHGGQVGVHARITTADRTNFYWLEFVGDDSLPTKLEVRSISDPTAK